MRACADLRVLFRAAAGPRRGFGHLVRCRSLARALGVRPLVALRGEQTAIEAAMLLGCDVVVGEPGPLLRAMRPHVLVVDDPVASEAKRWIEEARRTGGAVATVHDLGIGCLDGDLVIDGSVANGARPLGPRDRRRVLRGTDFAVLDPAIADARESETDPHRVIIALGGGPRIALARRIARRIAAAAPDADIHVATGLVADPPETAARRARGRITWIGARDGLASELRRSAVAVVGGGVLLYEACALGVAAVGVPVVPAQRPTVAAFVKRGAARGAAQPPSPPRVAAEAVRLLRDEALRRRVAKTGLRLVDGRGAERAAAAVSALVEERR